MRNLMFQIMSGSTRLGFQDQILWGTSMTTYEKHVMLTLSESSLYLMQINEMFTYLKRQPIPYELRFRLSRSFLITAYPGMAAFIIMRICLEYKASLGPLHHDIMNSKSRSRSGIPTV